MESPPKIKATTRVTKAQAMNLASWLIENRHPVEYSDERGAWRSLVLSSADELKALQIPSGMVFIPYPERPKNPPAQSASSALSGDQQFKDELEKTRALPIEAREKLMVELSFRLSTMSPGKIKTEAAVQTIVDAAKSTFLVSRATFEQPLYAHSNLGAVNKIKKETREVVNWICSHLEDHAPASFVLDFLRYCSSGSTFGHVSRVFFQTLGLIQFFNQSFERENVSGVLRSVFPKVYQEFYRRILPDAEKLTFDRTFYRFGAFSDEEVLDYALGALLHDIGKVPEIEYFEGAESYNRSKVVEHAFAGYGILARTYEKNRAVAHMAGDHHEYYGHKDGYGVLTSVYGVQAKKTGQRTIYALSSLLSQVESREALAYFPSKFLEIVDVFDALTDPTRQYRKRQSYTEEEALRLMKKTFVEEALKIDPVLFDFFCRYLHDQGVEIPLGDLLFNKEK